MKKKKQKQKTTFFFLKLFSFARAKWLAQQMHASGNICKDISLCACIHLHCTLIHLCGR